MSQKSDSPLSAETPIYVPAWRDHAGDMVPELLLQRRPPGHELKPHPIIDHGEPARRERDALAIDARDVLAFGGWAMGEPGLGRQSGGGLIELAPAQRVEKVASEDDPLALPPGQILLDEMIDPAVHRLADLGAKAAAAERRLLGEKLAVEPGGAGRRDLRLDREVRSSGERQALAAAGVVVGSRLDDRPRLGVARHFQVGEDKMVRAPVDAVDDGVGRALQLVVQAALDQASQDRLCGLVAVKREAGDVGLAFLPRSSPGASS